MTDSALLASALDPAVGERILNRQIAVAQIGAEASAKHLILHYKSLRDCIN